LVSSSDGFHGDTDSHITLSSMIDFAILVLPHLPLSVRRVDFEIGIEPAQRMSLQWLEGCLFLEHLGNVLGRFYGLEVLRVDVQRWESPGVMVDESVADGQEIWEMIRKGLPLLHKKGMLQF